MSALQRKRSQAAGFSLIELLIVIVILGILATLSTLYLISSRRAANGASAVAAMRVLSQTQTSYSAGTGNQNYGTPQDLFREELIDASLASACIPTPTMATRSGLPAEPFRPKSGFVFEVGIVTASGSTPPSYTVLGRPLTGTGIARDGDRTFFVNETGVIRASNNSAVAATISSPPID